MTEHVKNSLTCRANLLVVAAMIGACVPHNRASSVSLAAPNRQRVDVDVHSPVVIPPPLVIRDSPARHLRALLPVSGASFSTGTSIHRELCRMVEARQLTVTTLRGGMSFCAGIDAGVATSGTFRLRTNGDPAERVVRLGDGWHGQRTANFHGDGRDALFVVRQLLEPTGYRYEGVVLETGANRSFAIPDMAPGSDSTRVFSTLTGFDWNDDGFGDALIVFALGPVETKKVRIFFGSANGLTNLGSTTFDLVASAQSGISDSVAVLQVATQEGSEVLVFFGEHGPAESLQFYSRNRDQIGWTPLKTSLLLNQYIVTYPMAVQPHETDRSLVVGTTSVNQRDRGTVEFAVDPSGSLHPIAVEQFHASVATLTWTLRGIYDQERWAVGLVSPAFEHRELVVHVPGRRAGRRVEQVLPIRSEGFLQYFQLHPSNSESLQVLLTWAGFRGSPAQQFFSLRGCSVFALLRGASIESLRCAPYAALGQSFEIFGGGTFASDDDTPSLVLVYERLVGQRFQTSVKIQANTTATATESRGAKGSRSRRCEIACGWPSPVRWA